MNKAQAHGESWTHDLWIKTHVPYHIGIAAMQANLRIYVEAIRSYFTQDLELMLFEFTCL